MPDDASNPQENAQRCAPKRDTHWTNLTFLVTLHTAGLLGLALYLQARAPSVIAVGLCVVGFGLTTFGISAGYHRLFSHRSYATGPVLRTLMLLLGTAATQNSALAWATNHRLHHLHTDTDRDPYNAKRGFWYSHVGWVVLQDLEDTCDVSDLRADRLVMLQHRFYVPLVVVVSFLLPTAVGALFGDALGGLLFGGIWRLLISYHATFCINSVAHIWGTQPYSTKTTARDSWIVALVTMGEGYHNFHHTFPGDYRNGLRFFDFDPPKWVLAVFARLGWIWSVRRTPGHVVALRRLKQARAVIEAQASLAPPERQALLAQAEKCKTLLQKWSTAALTHGSARQTEPVPPQQARRSFWKAFNAWQANLQS